MRHSNYEGIYPLHGLTPGTADEALWLTETVNLPLTLIAKIEKFYTWIFLKFYAACACRRLYT